MIKRVIERLEAPLLQGDPKATYFPFLRAELTAMVKDLREAEEIKALQFIKELSSECLDNGDVRVGTAAEVAMRHIWRRADEAL